MGSVWSDSALQMSSPDKIPAVAQEKYPKSWKTTGKKKYAYFNEYYSYKNVKTKYIITQ